MVSRVNAHKAAMIAICDGFPPDWPAFFAGIRSLNNNTPIMNSWAGDGTFWYPKSPAVSNYWYVDVRLGVRRRPERRSSSG